MGQSSSVKSPLSSFQFELPSFRKYTSIMKVTLVFLAAFCAVALSADLRMLVRDEVKAIYLADANLTVDNCTTKCDALFDLVAGHDEQTPDAMCRQECSCQKNNSCDNHNNHHQDNHNNNHANT